MEEERWLLVEIIRNSQNNLRWGENLKQKMRKMRGTSVKYTRLEQKNKNEKVGSWDHKWIRTRIVGRMGKYR